MRIRARNFYVVLNAASRLTDFFWTFLITWPKKRRSKGSLATIPWTQSSRNQPKMCSDWSWKLRREKWRRKRLDIKKTKWTYRVRSGNDIAQMIFQDSCMFLRMKRIWQKKYWVIPTNSFEYLLAKLIKLIRRNWFTNHKLLNGNFYCVCGFNNIQKDSSL